MSLWNVVTNWLALIAAAFSMFVVGKYVTFPVFSVEIKAGPGGGLGDIFLWFIKIPVGILIHFFLSFIFPIVLILSMQFALAGWQVAMGMPVGQMITQTGDNTEVWLSDTWAALTGKPENIQNTDEGLKFLALNIGGANPEEFNSKENSSVEVTEAPASATPEPSGVTHEREIVGRVLLPTKDPMTSLKEARQMGCIGDAIWASDNIPSGEYYVSSNSFGKLTIQPLSGPWSEIEEGLTFCLKKDSSQTLSRDQKKLSIGDTFIVP